MGDLATSPELSDIGTREDCAALVRAFYTQALTDEVIGFLFTDIAQLDLEHHLPRITRFWETVLLGAGTYGGGAFRPHLELNLQVRLRRGHFERWLWLWQGTVDALYAGPVAEEAKRHAARVAAAFSARIEAINAAQPDPGPNVSPEPGHGAGPEPGHGAGPEPGHGAGPEPGRDPAPESRHGVGPEPGRGGAPGAGLTVWQVGAQRRSV